MNRFASIDLVLALSLAYFSQTILFGFAYLMLVFFIQQSNGKEQK